MLKLIQIFHRRSNENVFEFLDERCNLILKAKKNSGFVSVGTKSCEEVRYLSVDLS